jgi:hypothetical protein
VPLIERNPAIHFYEKSGAALAVAKKIGIGGVLQVPQDNILARRNSVLNSCP